MNRLQRVVPYTTKSGLQIGCRYDPPRRDMSSREGDRIQSALLLKGSPVESRMAPSVRYYIMSVAIAAVCVFTILAPRG